MKNLSRISRDFLKDSKTRFFIVDDLIIEDIYTIAHSIAGIAVGIMLVDARIQIRIETCSSEWAGKNMPDLVHKVLYEFPLDFPISFITEYNDAKGLQLLLFGEQYRKLEIPILIDTEIFSKSHKLSDTKNNTEFIEKDSAKDSISISNKMMTGIEKFKIIELKNSDFSYSSQGVYLANKRLHISGLKLTVLNLLIEEYDKNGVESIVPRDKIMQAVRKYGSKMKEKNLRNLISAIRLDIGRDIRAFMKEKESTEGKTLIKSSNHIGYSSKPKGYYFIP